MRGLWRLVRAALKVETDGGARLIFGYGALSPSGGPPGCRLVFPRLMTLEIGPGDVTEVSRVPGDGRVLHVSLAHPTRLAVTRLRRSRRRMALGDRLLLVLRKSLSGA
jgi:hypothetical protein